MHHAQPIVGAGRLRPRRGAEHWAVGRHSRRERAALRRRAPRPGRRAGPGRRRRSASCSPALIYYYRVLDPAEAKEQFPGVHRFLAHKWYFDELYSAMLVRPALVVAGWCRWFDTDVHRRRRRTASPGSTVRLSQLGRPVRQRRRRRPGQPGRPTCSTASAAGCAACRPATCAATCCSWCWRRSGIFVLLSYFVALAAAG